MARELIKIVTQINNLIEIGDGAWRKIAELLTEVRDGKLYLQNNHKTFKAFIESEWGKTRNWAYNLMKSHAVVKRLTHKDAHRGGRPDNITERAARALSVVPEELREAVVGHIADSHKPVNSATVQEATAIVAPKSKEKTLDKEGHVVPSELVDDYEKREQFKSLAKALKDIRDQLAALRKSGRIWKKVSSVAESHIEQAIGDIEDGIPHTVCVECQGWLDTTRNGSCISCNSTGLMSKRQFKMADEVKMTMHRGKK